MFEITSETSPFCQNNPRNWGRCSVNLRVGDLGPGSGMDMKPAPGAL